MPVDFKNVEKISITPASYKTCSETLATPYENNEPELHIGDVVELSDEFDNLIGKITSRDGAFYHIDSSPKTFMFTDFKYVNHKKYDYSIGDEVYTRYNFYTVRYISKYAKEENTYYLNGFLTTYSKSELIEVPKLKTITIKEDVQQKLKDCKLYPMQEKLYEMNFNIKEKDEMINVLKMWNQKQEKAISEYEKTSLDILVDEDERCDALKKLLEQMDTIAKDGGYNEKEFTSQLSLSRYTTEKTDALIMEVHHQVDSMRVKLATYYKEVETQLQACETYNQKREILKIYNILDEDGRIMEGDHSPWLNN